MKVLVLGHNGMLGHMVVKYLRSNDIDVITLKDRWPLLQLPISQFNGDYIINCIGAIPQRTNIFNINWEVPIWLDINAPCKVIHPGTDCEADDDDYGISKNIAANYINTFSKRTKAIKTSILGPELSSKASLFEWFLSQENAINGYCEHFWNGNTTLEWSKHCLRLMKDWKAYNHVTIIASKKCISKYDLIKMISKIWKKDIVINRDTSINAYKCLNGDIPTNDIETQLIELKEFYYDS